MKLTVIVTGLVLLAPDAADGRLHLFFPQMDMSRRGAEHHAPFLKYTAISGRDSVSLAGWTLDLSTLATAGNAPAVPHQVIDLRSVFSRGVPRAWVTGTPPSRVQGRVSLPWPDAITAPNSARWLLVRGTRQDSVILTNEVVLHYELPQSPPSTWTLSSLPSGPGGTKRLPAWRPGGSGDTIRIANQPPRDTGALGWMKEGVHFQGYVGLLPRGPIDWLRPRPRLYFYDRRLPGMSPYNCMLATADVEP